MANEIKVSKFYVEKIVSLPSLVELVLRDDDDKNYKAVIKDNTKSFLKVYNVEDQILCKFRVINKNNLEIIQIKRVIAKETKIDLEKYINKFDELKGKVKDKEYLDILNNVFSKEIRDLFFLYPYSISRKRNSAHSLLLHTIEVTEIALDLSKYYGEINTDLLITGSLLHNVGKIQSFDFDDPKRKAVETDWEMLIGHVPISALYISKIMPSDIDQDKAINLYHMILSFQKNNYIDCKIKESFILRKAFEINNEFYLGDFNIV